MDIIPLVPFEFTPGDSMNVIEIPAEKMNVLVRNEYEDTFDFWQQLSGLRSFMRMNRLGKFTVTDVKGYSGIWGQMSGCSFLETGGLAFGTREITPIPIYDLSAWCSYDTIGEVYETLLRWDNGDIDESSVISIWNIFVKELMANSTQSLRNTFTTNKLRDLTDDAVYVAAPDATQTTRIAQLKAVSASHALKGELALIEETYASDNSRYAHLKVGGNSFVVAGDFTNGVYTGSVKTKLNEIKAAAPSKLRNLINSGGSMTTNGKEFKAVVGLSNSYYSALHNEYNAQIDQVATNGMRITKERVTVGNTTREVFYYDMMLVVPLSEVSGLDDLFVADTHVMGIFGSGILQNGHSFGKYPSNVETNQVGYRLEMGKTIASTGVVAGVNTYETGKFKALTQGLAATALADPDFLACNITLA